MTLESAPRYRQMAEMLYQNAILFPDHGVGYVQPDRSIRFTTFPELLDQSRRLAAGFHACGIRQGDVVILSLETNAEIIPVLWACFISGVVPALLQPPFSFTAYNPAAEKAEKVFHRLGRPRVILSHNHVDTWLRSGIPADLLVDVSTVPLDSEEIPPVTIADTDLAMLQFSSGSTGDPKGVMLTHHNLLHNICDIRNGLQLRPDEETISWMPLYHDMGLVGFHLTTLYAGTSGLFIEPSDFIKNSLLWLDTMSHRPSVITGCPNFGQTIINRFISRRKDPDWDLSGIRVIFNGAEPISIPAMQEFNANLSAFGYQPKAMLPCYGMAEASLAITFAPIDEEPEVVSFRRSLLFSKGIVEEHAGPDDEVQLVNLGKHLTYCDFIIADDDDNPLPPDRTGHVLVKGDNITSGYYHNPEASKEVFRNGWLHTGDLGFVHKGDLFIMGRMKDIIFINGTNYYSTDLESVALNADGVTYGKIVMAGYFDEKEGKDKVVVFMVAPANEASIGHFRSIQQHFLVTLGLMIDTFIPVRSQDIPRTSSGKIQRYKMVNRFQRGECETIVKI